MGVYPPGTLVRLSTGDIAVVLKVYAPDPYRPRVRVIADAAAQPLTRPYDANLWAQTDTASRPASVVSVVDGAALGIDALAYL
jgi:hypothetical protein